MQKNGPHNVPRKKVRISIGIIDLFAYSIFKNIEILSNQGVVPNSTKLIYQTTGNVWAAMQKKVHITFLEKKLYFNRNYRLIRLFYF